MYIYLFNQRILFHKYISINLFRLYYLKVRDHNKKNNNLFIKHLIIVIIFNPN